MVEACAVPVSTEPTDVDRDEAFPPLPVRVLLCVIVAAAGATPVAGVQIARVVGDPVRNGPVEGGRAFGAAGAYERLIGFAHGELDPDEPRNAIIQDLQLAPRNARGNVEDVTTFAKPTDASRASGLLFYGTVNRGNEARGNDEFLMSRGTVILRSGWQGDIPANDDGTWGGRTFSIRVPSARNSDGAPITGRIGVHFWNVEGTTAELNVLRRAVPYLPVSLDTREATLTTTSFLTNDGRMGLVTTIPHDGWAWADCTKTPFPGDPDPTRICVAEGFDPLHLYELVFTAKDPLVLRIGFAATRDLVSFFRHALEDGREGPNPAAGLVTRVIATGRSQSGQFLRTFINLGFNEDLAGRAVWDGAIPDISGRQLSLNVRFALPDGTATICSPNAQGVVWWSDWEDTVRGHVRAGLLGRCRVSGTCPKVFETFGSGEMWGLRMSPGLVGTDAVADIELPDNVRRYYAPGTTHGGGEGGFSVVPDPPPVSMLGPCTLPANPNPMAEAGRALLVALDDWITKGTEPPPSRYPRLSDGTLAPATKSSIGFPEIPGVSLTDLSAKSPLRPRLRFGL
jgi:hypothetical protein